MSNVFFFLVVFFFFRKNVVHKPMNASKKQEKGRQCHNFKLNKLNIGK